MSMRWATGSPKSRLRVPAPDPGPLVDEPAPDHVPATPAALEGRGEDESPLAYLAERASAIAAEWAPTAGRILLGVVFFWFGYHEMVQPWGWTQYVPVASETSTLAIILVLVHGWVLFVLAAALVFGIAPRAAAAVASVLMLEIVISLAVTKAAETTVQDIGVLGLAVCLIGCKNQRLVLRG
jgi:uncharacterized membrane protein YphA (DoxX/SURF4 family)